MSQEIISKCIKQWAMQEEVRIIFNPSIANTHWTDTVEIVSESMLVHCIKFKAQIFCLVG